MLVAIKYIFVLSLYTKNVKTKGEVENINAIWSHWCEQRSAVLEIVNLRVVLVEPCRQTVVKLAVNIYLKKKKNENDI